MCCCENKESTYWYKYSYERWKGDRYGWVTSYGQGFITTKDFQWFWENYAWDEHTDTMSYKLEMVVKL